MHIQGLTSGDPRRLARLDGFAKIGDQIAMPVTRKSHGIGATPGAGNLTNCFCRAVLTMQRSLSADQRGTGQCPVYDKTLGVTWERRRRRGHGPHRPRSEPKSPDRKVLTFHPMQPRGCGKRLHPFHRPGQAQH